MAEYIDREAAVKAFNNFDAGRADSPPFTLLTPEEFAEYLYEFPAADVAPVIHSYWETYSCSQFMGTDGWGEPKWRDGRFYICHNYKCRRKTVVKSNFCPNCGAKMQGAGNE